MTSRRKCLIGLLLLAIAGTVAVLVFVRPSPEKSGPNPKSEKPEAIEDESVLPIGLQPIAQESEELDKLPNIPSREQIDRIEEYKGNTNLSMEQVASFKKLLKDSRIHNIGRNNIATLLVRQDKVDQSLFYDFLEMYEKKDEDPGWRDYCIQFMGQMLPHSDEQGRMGDMLLKIATEDNTTIGGTALIQLVLHSDELKDRHKGDISKAIKEKINTEALLPELRLSIIALVGELKDVSQLKTIRGYARSNNPDLQRTAVGTLGVIGDKNDLEWLRLLKSKTGERSVILAANAAIARLEKKTGE